jgi:hypothetical protein
VECIDGTREERTYYDFYLGVLSPHSPDQLREGSDDVRHSLVLLYNIVGSQVHGHHVGRILVEPAVELVLVGNVDGQKARVAFIVAVVFGVAAVVLRLAGADKVNGFPLGGLQLFPEQGAPADDFGDGVPKGHEAEGGVLGEGATGQGREKKVLEGDHLDAWWCEDAAVGGARAFIHNISSEAAGGRGLEWPMSIYGSMSAGPIC